MLQIFIDSFGNSYDLLREKLDSWAQQIILLLPNFITAILVFLAFLLGAKLAENIIFRIFHKESVGGDIVKIISKIIYIVLILTGAFFALGVLHLDKTVTSLLAGAGIIGLALSFAFQDIATNFVSGFIIAFRKPFRVGDLVETNDYMGNITSISLRAIHLRTFQGQDVIIPSKDVLQKPIKNFSTYGHRRIDLVVGVSYGDDLEKAALVAKEAVSKLEEIDSSRPVDVFYEEFADSSVNMKVMFWVNLVQNRNFLKARNDAVVAIHKAFNQNDITIPFPIRTLDFGIKGGEKLSSIIKDFQDKSEK